MLIHYAKTRGIADHGWLKSSHSFSFSDYYDPNRMGHGALRVLNDDHLAPGGGFGTHPHRDMEIISIPITGGLKHKDSVGNEGVIYPGEIQVMSAGSGILHSEFNASNSEWGNFLQLWILPKELGVRPCYAEKNFTSYKKKNTPLLIVSPNGEEESLRINQDAYLSLLELHGGVDFHYQRRMNKSGCYVFVITGDIRLNDSELSSRDGAGLLAEEECDVMARTSAQVLLIEVPI